MSQTTYFQKFANLMDQNIKGVQYGVYTLAGLGLVIALRSVRPFQKFQRPNDIPRHFIEKRMRFSGKVLKVQGGRNPILNIDHYPILSFPFTRSEKTLPVKVSGVDVTQNGGIWLSTLLQGSHVNFIPLRTDSDAVQALVYQGNKNVGEHLVSIGFATVDGLDFQLQNDKQYSKYYKSLLAAERRAERKGAGIWLSQESLFQRVFNRAIALRYSLT